MPRELVELAASLSGRRHEWGMKRSDGVDAKREELLDEECRVSRVDRRRVAARRDERAICRNEGGDHEQQDRAQDGRKKTDAGS
jgi:hypothetical protein